MINSKFNWKIADAHKPVLRQAVLLRTERLEFIATIQNSYEVLIVCYISKDDIRRMFERTYETEAEAIQAIEQWYDDNLKAFEDAELDDSALD